jgi:hypothetical protein
MAIGVLTYLATFLFQFYKPALLIKTPVRVAGIVITIIGVYFFGSYSTEMVWRKRVEEVQAKVAVAEAASKDANTKLAKASKQKVKVIHERQVVIHAKIIHDAAKMDATCIVDPVAIQDLNAAAKSPLDQPQDKK